MNDVFISPKYGVGQVYSAIVDGIDYKEVMSDLLVNKENYRKMVNMKFKYGKSHQNIITTLLEYDNFDVFKELVSIIDFNKTNGVSGINVLCNIFYNFNIDKNKYLSVIADFIEDNSVSFKYWGGKSDGGFHINNVETELLKFKYPTCKKLLQLVDKEIALKDVDKYINKLMLVSNDFHNIKKLRDFLHKDVSDMRVLKNNFLKAIYVSCDDDLVFGTKSSFFEISEKSFSILTSKVEAVEISPLFINNKKPQKGFKV